MFVISTRVFTRFKILNNRTCKANINITLTRRSTSRCGRYNNARARFFHARRNRISGVPSNFRLSIRLRFRLSTRSIRRRNLLHLTRSCFKQSAYVPRAQYEQHTNSSFHSQGSGRINFHFNRSNNGNSRTTFNCRFRASSYL